MRGLVVLSLVAGLLCVGVNFADAAPVKEAPKVKSAKKTTKAAAPKDENKKFSEEEAGKHERALPPGWGNNLRIE